VKFFGEQPYIKNVKHAKKKRQTFLPELYKDKFDSKTGDAKRQKLPRPISPVDTSST
jgi:hypothetical protein